MIDKKYLDNLKENDPIAYYELMEDPLVTGGDDLDYIAFYILIVVMALAIVFLMWTYFN